MICKMSVWAWHCDATQGGYLFHGNHNRGLPPFHLGGIENILCGEHLVWEHTRRALKMDVRIIEWNERFPCHRVKPQLITIEMRTADTATRSRRKKKEGRSCDMSTDYSSIGAVCHDCAKAAGFTPKNKVVGVWMDECGICHKRKPCTDLLHDWRRPDDTLHPQGPSSRSDKHPISGNPAGK